MKLWLSDPKTLERFAAMAGFPAYGLARGVRQSSSTAQIALWKA
jgi:hypothetical protein